ncbi:NUDIX hydrolase [Candidatus Peregrinibacteria bacterium]|nr:NUDIX hydrolase [Candidatus Peregrinibacteria bacterium]MBI3816430.1 NUDIX hydrolase [Candidatus Peregrinibacteria bacterium]
MQKEVLYTGYGWTLAIDESALPDGRVKRAVVVQRCDSVHILAFPTPSRIFLIREFRPRYGSHLWMLPSGRADKENDHEAAAQRELQEETGFRAEHLTYYCSTRHSESLDCANHLYVATQLIKDPLPQDSDELIGVHDVSLDEAIGNVLGSPVVHTASAYGLLRYAHDLRNGLFHT